MLDRLRRLFAHRKIPTVRRPELLAQLRAALLASGPQRPVVLQGPLGVGRSWLVDEYLRRHGKEYAFVGRVRAASDLALARDMAELVQRAGIPGFMPGSGNLAALRAWRRRAARAEPWLLVFDDAGTLSTVEPYVPLAGAGHVLVTTSHWTDADWTEAAFHHAGEGKLPTDRAVKVRPRKFVVTPWTAAEATAFLLDHAAPDETDDAGAGSQIVEALGTRPLPLVLVAARAASAGLAAVVDELRGERGAPDAGDEDASVDALAYGVVRRTWRSVSGADDLLLQWAVLGQDVISSELDAPGDKRAARAALLAAGVAVEDPGGVRLLEAVRRCVLRDAPAEARTAAYAQAWARVGPLMADPIGSDAVETWPVASRVAPHAHALALRAFEPGAAGAPADSEAWAMLRALWQLYTDCQDPVAAMRTFEPLMSVVLAEDGPHRARRYETCLRTGQAALEAGWVDLATETLLVAVTEASERTGPDAEIERGVAGLAYAQALVAGKALAAAKTVLTWTLDVAAQAGRPERLSEAVCASWLGEVCRDTGDLPGAQAAFERAVAAAEREPGYDVASAVSDARTLGELGQKRGDPATARRGFERAVALYDRSFADDLSGYWALLIGLAAALRALGEITELRAVCERALARVDLDLVFRPDLELAAVYAEAAEAALAAGDHAAAAKHFAGALEVLDADPDEDRAKAVMTDVLNDARPQPGVADRAWVAYLRGRHAQVTGATDAALGCFARARDIAGKDRDAAPWRAAAWRAEAEVWLERGAADRALAILGAALPAARADLGARHPEVVALEKLLGRCALGRS